MNSKSYLGERISLNIDIPKDKGETWEIIKNVEVDTDGWYCYIAIHFTGKDE